MKYTKRFMSISELVAYGWSRYMLKAYAHIKGAPVVWTPQKGKVLFDTTKLDLFASNLR